MCSDIGTTSRVCAMYSFTGILFTVSTASYHPSCVIGGAKRCSRLIGPRNGSSCVVCKSCWCPVAEIDIDVVLLGGGARSKLPHIKVTPSEAGKDDVMWVASVSNGGRMVVPKGLVQFRLCRCSFSGLFGCQHFSKFPHCHLHVVLIYPHSP